MLPKYDNCTSALQRLLDRGRQRDYSEPAIQRAGKAKVGRKATGGGSALLLGLIASLNTRKRREGFVMKRCTLVVLVMSLLGLLRPEGVGAVSVSPGGMGDALIFQAILVSGVDTLLAIESFSGFTGLHRVRFRDGTTGASVLEFTLCLPPGATWTAGVFRQGSLTRVMSASTLLVNGSATPLNTNLADNPTRAFMEVIGLRSSPDPTVCTDPSIGGDVSNFALTGRVYYVNGGQSPPLIYSTNAVALVDFADTKISDGTVFGDEDVAEALIAQGVVASIDFSTRYFVPTSFGAVTQVVLSFPTGPNSIGCPSCRVPSNLSITPFTESGTPLPTINLPSDTSLVRVITLTRSDIANDSGLLDIFETSAVVSIPLVGFGVNTTATSASAFFNALFPITIF